MTQSMRGGEVAVAGHGPRHALGAAGGSRGEGGGEQCKYDIGGPPYQQ